MIPNMCRKVWRMSAPAAARTSAAAAAPTASAVVGSRWLSSGGTPMSSLSDPAVEEALQYYGRKRQTNVSLRALLDTGNGTLVDKLNSGNSAMTLGDATVTEKVLIQVACFLHRELPVRLAHRAVELESSDLFKTSESIMNVCKWYKKSFQELRACPAPVNLEKEAVFSKAIESIYERHSATLITMAKGAHEIRQTLQADVNSFAEQHQVQKRLDEFYMSRIGIRVRFLYACFRGRLLGHPVHAPPHPHPPPRHATLCGADAHWAVPGLAEAQPRPHDGGLDLDQGVAVRHRAAGHRRRRVHVHTDPRRRPGGACHWWSYP